MHVYWNNDLIDVQNKTEYQFFDRAFQFGDGIYETIAVKNRKPAFITDHLERLFANADRLNIPVSNEISNWSDNISQVIDKDNIENGFIKVIVTRGIMADAGLSFPKHEKPSILIWGASCDFKSIKDKKPLKILISQLERRNQYSLISYTKTLNYLNNIIAKSEADAAGYDESIILNTHGNICEGTTSNIFLIDHSNKILTPEIENGLLNGVTRIKVLQAAMEFNLEVEQGVYGPDKFKHAKGCFLTSTLLDIAPVSEVRGIAEYNVSDISEVLGMIEERYNSYIN